MFNIESNLFYYQRVHWWIENPFTVTSCVLSSSLRTPVFSDSLGCTTTKPLRSISNNRIIKISTYTCTCTYESCKVPGNISVKTVISYYKKRGDWSVHLYYRLVGHKRDNDNNLFWRIIYVLWRIFNRPNAKETKRFTSNFYEWTIWLILLIYWITYIELLISRLL